MADNQVTEKEQIKATAQAEGADTKTAFSNEAFDNAVKHSQLAGSSGKDFHVADQAQKGATSDSSLPNIILHGGAEHSTQASPESKQAVAESKQAIAEQLNKRLDSNEAQQLNKIGMPNDQNELSKTKILESLGNALKNGDLTKEQFNKQMIDFVDSKDGVQKLGTGDYLVKEDGKQTLFTPNGDHITLNPDGTNSIKGDISKVSTDKDGLTTVNFGDGSSATFDKEGFHNVSRGNRSVTLLNGGISEFPNKPSEPIEPSYPFPGHHPFDPDMPIHGPLHFSKPMIEYDNRLQDLKKSAPAQNDNLKSRD